ncbi:septation protein SepH [Modestobacter sp. SYSU DS0657]
MRALRLVALSDDGKHLVLAADAVPAADGSAPSEDGEQFQLPVDDRLREALAERSRPPGQTSGDQLPPRVIQARIRAGESPEEVAHASGTRVERIMRFAYPVLQERARVAEQAREARVRLSDGTPGIPLEEFMSERLRLLGTDVDAIRWDAHRTEDGAWQVRADWDAGEKSGSTRWRYEIPAKSVTPVDAATTDFAEGTRLVRVVPDVPAGSPAAPAGRRGISVVRPGGAEEPAPDEGPADVDEAGVDEAGIDEADPDAAPAQAGPAAADPAPSAAQVDPDTQDTVVLGRLAEPGGDHEFEFEDEDDPRARIPAWEDIVFGVRRRR